MARNNLGTLKIFLYNLVEIIIMSGNRNQMSPVFSKLTPDDLNHDKQDVLHNVITDISHIQKESGLIRGLV